MKRLFSQPQDGFTLVELMIAIALFTTIMVVATGLFGRAADSQGKTIAIKNLQESLDYSFQFMKREAESAKKDLTACGSGCGINDLFCVNGVNSETVYFRNKNDECVRYFVQADSNGVQRLAVTRDGLPAGPYFTYLTSADVSVTSLKFATSALNNDPDYLSARLTMFIAAKPVSAIDGQTVNLQTSIALRPFVCGQTIYDRDNFSYKTILINDQCWLAENLKTKRKPNGACINTATGIYTVSADCLTIQSGTPTNNGGFDDSGRDCISPTGNARSTETNCGNGYALYTWPAAMDGSIIEGAQGICPRGWHIPTQEEVDELVDYLGGVGAAGDDLKTGGSSGFNGMLVGNRRTDGDTFENYNDFANIWSSTRHDSAKSYFYWLDRTNDDVGTDFDHNTYGFSVRCLKN